MPNHFAETSFFLILILCCNLAAAAAAASVNPEYRNFLLEQLRASEESVARNYCAIFYESIADSRASIFWDEAGLLNFTYVNVNNIQPMARSIRMSAVSIPNG